MLIEFDHHHHPFCQMLQGLSPQHHLLLIHQESLQISSTVFSSGHGILYAILQPILVLMKSKTRGICFLICRVFPTIIPSWFILFLHVNYHICVGIKVLFTGEPNARKMKLFSTYLKRVNLSLGNISHKTWNLVLYLIVEEPWEEPWTAVTKLQDFF